MTATAPLSQAAGMWLVAGHKLGRPVPTSEKYPHICGARCPCHPWQPPASRRDCGSREHTENHPATGAKV